MADRVRSGQPTRRVISVRDVMMARERIHGTGDGRAQADSDVLSCGLLLGGSAGSAPRRASLSSRAVNPRGGRPLVAQLFAAGVSSSYHLSLDQLRPVHQRTRDLAVLTQGLTLLHCRIIFQTVSVN